MATIDIKETATGWQTVIAGPFKGYLETHDSEGWYYIGPAAPTASVTGGRVYKHLPRLVSALAGESLFVSGPIVGTYTPWAG